MVFSRDLTRTTDFYILPRLNYEGETHRVVLPPTKYIANSHAGEPPSSVHEVQFATIQEEQHSRLSEVNNLKQLEQRLIWTPPLSSGYFDHKMVLPKASLDASNSESQRRVVLPQGESRSQLSVAAMSQPHSSLPTSKSATARQAYQEELEFLKLKLRYMQNDIEFKQNQIDSAKTSLSTKGSTASNEWNRNSHHVSTKARLNPDIRVSSSSNSDILLQSKLHPGSSATKWTAPVTALQQIKTKVDVPDKCSYLPGTNVSSHLSTDIIKCSVVTKSNNSSATTSWSPHLTSRARSDALGHSRSPTDIKTVYHVSESMVYPVHSHILSKPNSISSHCPIVPTQAELTTCPTSAYSVGSKVVSSGSLLNVPLYTKLTTTQPPSAFQRLGNHRLPESSKPVYVSPDKRLVVFVSKTVSATLVPSDLITVAGRSAVASGFLEGSAGIEDCSYVAGISNSLQSTSNSHYQDHRHLGKTGGAVSISKYKLVKNTSSLPVVVTTTQTPPGVGSTSSLSSYTDSNIFHDFLPSIQPIKAAVRRASQVSRLGLRSPNLKMEIAAKLVSKYKLKKLSPTTTSHTAPPLFYGKTQLRKSPLFFQQGNVKTVGQYSKDKHKLDRRPMLNNSVISSLNYANFVDQVSSSHFSVLTKKHKIDRRQIFIHPSKSTRDLQQTLSRSKLKIDKREQRNNVFLEKLDAQGFRNVHRLDRRSFKGELDVSHRHPALAQEASHYLINGEHVIQSAGKVSTRTRKSASKYHWKTANTLQPKSVHLTAADNSRFKWSRPNVQAQSGAWQQLRQKLQLMLNKKHRHSRFKFTKYATLAASASTFKKTSKAGDYKTNLVTIDGITYRSTGRKLTRTRRSSGSSSARKSVPTPSSRSVTTLKSQGSHKMKLVSVGGVHFHVDRSGKRLRRTQPGVSSAPAGARKSSTLQADFNIVNYANRAVHRSIAITAAKYKKHNQKSKTVTQHCIFFGRFGKCHRGDLCPFDHDPEKVAVCTRFLRGKCDTKGCPFSHKASVNKMPVCLFYLRGSCSREKCPYIHVRVNPNAPVCKDFRNGFCALGEKCKKVHSHVCPSFAITGTCARAGTCTMLHRINQKEEEGLSLQAKPLLKNARGQHRHVDLIGFVPKSFSAPTFATTLAAQPSYISLETNTLPSFISLETIQQEGSVENERVPDQWQPGCALDKVGASVVDVVQQCSSTDAIPSIRPSFLAKKFVIDKS